MKILLESTHFISPLDQLIERAIKLIDKKIASIALLIFSSLAAIYFIFRQATLENLADGTMTYDTSLFCAKYLGKSVRKLTLQTNKNISNDLDALFKSCPNIEELQLVNCIISEDGMKLLPNNLESLILIDVNLSDEILSKIPQNLRRFQILYSGLLPSSLTNKFIQNLPRSLQRLTLMIHSPNNLTDEIFMNLPPDLRFLFVNSDNITEHALAYKFPEKLECLWFRCPKARITDLRSLPRTLKTLDISSCQVPDPSTLTRNKPPYIKVLRLPNIPL